MKKITVLRGDRKDVHYGMAMIVQMVMKEFFGERDLLLDKNEDGFTQLTFEIADGQETKGFVDELSRLNPLYVVVV